MTAIGSETYGADIVGAVTLANGRRATQFLGESTSVGIGISIGIYTVGVDFEWGEAGYRGVRFEGGIGASLVPVDVRVGGSIPE